MTGQHAAGRRWARLGRAWSWLCDPPQDVGRGPILLLGLWLYSAGRTSDAGIRVVTIVGTLWLILTVAGLLTPLIRWLIFLWRADRWHRQTDPPRSFSELLDDLEQSEGNDPT